MCRLYLKEQGSKISCRGTRLIVTKEDETLLETPLHRIDEIQIYGRVAVTAAAMALLLARQIPLILSTSRGRIRGVLSPPLSPALSLRKSLYKASEDNEYILQFSADIVKSKINNAAGVLRRYYYNHRDPFLKQKAKDILDVASMLQNAADIDSLRGYEGIAAKHYFAGLVRIFESLNMNFYGRIRRPPKDPVNSVLSFIYIVLTDMVSCKLQQAGLDVYCGIMHKPNRNAPALALDFVEQFRQPIADRFIMLVFNRKQLNAEDFEANRFYPCAIKDKSKNKLLENWEEFLDTPQKLLDGNKIKPEELIIKKVDQFVYSLLNDKPYENYVIC